MEHIIYLHCWKIELDREHQSSYLPDDLRLKLQISHLDTFSTNEFTLARDIS